MLILRKSLFKGLRRFYIEKLLTYKIIFKIKYLRYHQIRDRAKKSFFLELLVVGKYLCHQLLILFS